MSRVRRLALIVALWSAAGSAAEIQLQQTVPLRGQAPSELVTYDGRPYAFDPMAGVLTPLGPGETLALPPGVSWSSMVVSGGTLHALTLSGGVQQWVPSDAAPVNWDVAGVADLDWACGAVWLLYRSGAVEKREAGTGNLISRWASSWNAAGKIHVSDALEQVSLAPIQGDEVRLYDTSGIHLRTLEGASSVRCADLALGTGGVLAVADRFAGTVELYSPLGVSLGLISDRGTLDGHTLRPASVVWEGESLWVLDPTLRRASEFAVTALGESVLPVPFMIGPGAGTTFEPEGIQFSVLPKRLVLQPDRVELEVTTAAGMAVARQALPLAGATDTLMWTPEVEWLRGEAYRWRVQAYAGELKSGWSAWSHFDIAPLPETYALLPNYPNPFNAATVIPFQVPDRPARQTRITVHNILGQRVRVLLDAPLEAGPQQVVWDGRNDHGHPVASGVYFVRLTHDRGVLTRKAVLLK